MTPDHIFAVANPAAMVCWVLLAIFPHRRAVTDAVAGVAMPALLALAYTAIIAAAFFNAQGSFATLDGVRQLFQNPWLLLAGWLHYLAFDLLVGSWEARDSVERGVPRWLLVPCLFLTLMFGPAGWLAYRAVRFRR